MGFHILLPGFGAKLDWELGFQSKLGWELGIWYPPPPFTTPDLGQFVLYCTLKLKHELAA